MSLPHENEPANPERVSIVLGYLRAGASCGIGEYEWKTIYACLEKCSGPIRLPNSAVGEQK